MTLNKDIINQTNRFHLNQPLNQMKFMVYLDGEGKEEDWKGVE